MVPICVHCFYNRLRWGRSICLLHVRTVLGNFEFNWWQLELYWPGKEIVRKVTRILRQRKEPPRNRLALVGGADAPRVEGELLRASVGQERGEAHVQGEQVRHGGRRERPRQESVFGRAEEGAVREENDVGYDAGRRFNMGVLAVRHAAWVLWVATRSSTTAQERLQKMKSHLGHRDN